MSPKIFKIKLPSNVVKFVQLLSLSDSMVSCLFGKLVRRMIFVHGYPASPTTQLNVLPGIDNAFCKAQMYKHIAFTKRVRFPSHEYENES